MALALQCSARPLPMQQRVLRAPSSSSTFVGARLPSTHLRVSSSQQRRQVVRMGLFGLGLPELAVIAGVAALIFGPSKLPELGKGLGKTVKSFQTAAKEFEQELKQAAAPDEEEAGKKKEGEQQPPSTPSKPTN